MSEPVRAVLAIFFTLAIIALLVLARGEPNHGSTTQSAAIAAIAV